MPRIKIKKFWLGIVLVLVILGGLAVAWVASRPEPVPRHIIRQVDYPIYYPAGEDYHTDQKSFDYDPSVKLLSYETQLVRTKHKLSVNQQSKPEDFSRASLDLQLASFKNKQDFKVKLGQVSMVASGKIEQIAVLETEQVLIFVKSDQLLSVPEWEVFFNALVEVEK